MNRCISMGLFVGRESELEKLNSVYGKGKAVLIGRRRIGKSTLIDRFCEGRRSLHLTCIDSTLRSNLDYIHRMVSNFRGEDSDEYRDYLDMKDDLARICSDGNNILVIDEYQYLVKADDSIDSFMQQLIDETLKHTESTLILCGSSVTVMKSTGEDGSHPLYGRFRHRIHLMPLSMEECRAFHPDMSDHDQMMMYLTFGGIPRYHEESEEGSYEDFFRRNCIEDTWIADEALFLLKVDYPNSQECDAVLSAIAGGSVRPKEIQGRSGIGTKYVEVVRKLLNNDVIGEVHPMLGAPSRPVYYIKDRFLAFYYGGSVTDSICSSTMIRRRPMTRCIRTSRHTSGRCSSSIVRTSCVVSIPCWISGVGGWTIRRGTSTRTSTSWRGSPREGPGWT